MARDGGKLMLASIVFAIAALVASADTEFEVAEGSSKCTDRCFQEEKACMQQTKGSASCNDQLLRCLASCR